MAEPRDAMMLILRNIQADISAMRVRLDDVGQRLNSMDGRLTSLEGLMTYALGLISRQQHSGDEIQRHIKDLQARVASLETRS
jgi:septal ring factor EnvC (AmiA/AmiB activator)